ncbi:hypothetical protein KUTeg_006346 [Tegillarca granosa]|uniref:Uncharacterized protein n=1 Tax=Tegillarca granosa TaxID=220873 RepID=A0ABQ9FK68_TEGGR|nr:hypothetical protein KUTeg_006346 [Tegillarca granosa]
MAECFGTFLKYKEIIKDVESSLGNQDPFVLKSAMLTMVGLLKDVEKSTRDIKWQNPDPQAQQNNNPIYRESPTLVKTVPNDKLYTVGNGEDSI